MTKSQVLALCVSAAGALLLAGASASAKGKINDFPTEARAEYVFACMASNERNQAFLHKCSCAIDTIASRMTYDDYVGVQTILAIQQTHSQNAQVYRSLDIVKDPLDKLYHAEAAAELKCF